MDALTMDPEAGGAPDLLPALVPAAEALPGAGQGEHAPEARKALVAAWTGAVQAAKQRWKPAYDRMRDNERFVRGEQWPNDPGRDKYVANIAIRHVQQRTADLYAKNPRVVARQRPRLEYQAWDGSAQTLQVAQQIMADAALGLIDSALVQSARLILMDAQQGYARDQVRAKVGRTMELLFAHQLSNQTLDFKQGMKNLVRRACYASVAYVVMDYQRTTGMLPSQEARLHDLRERLARIERLTAELDEGDITAFDAASETLRQQIRALEQSTDTVLDEGLVFDFPHPSRVIPDAKCTNAVTFQGCDWVAVEYPLTTAQVREVYGVKLEAGGFTPMKRQAVTDAMASASYMDRTGNDDPDGNPSSKSEWVAVWEVYSKRDQLIYTVAEGYQDWLREPMAPTIQLKQFWPIYGFALNPVDGEDDPWPVSDIDLIRSQQMEVNRSRQALREHRRANRPKVIVSAAVLSDNDRAQLKNPTTSDGIAVLELTGLAPGQKVDDLLQSFQGPGIDPNLYDVSPFFDDVQRSVGAQEANLGGTSNASATETSIAESSRLATSASAVDDLDELLTALARDGGRVLLTEMAPETVLEIVGPGAVWPRVNADEIARELYLEVEAGSTGRPNQAQEIQNAERVVPLLTMIPGINPEWLAKELLRRMDDRVRLEDAFAAGLPSIQSLNAQHQFMAKLACGPAPGEAPGAGPQAGTQPAQAIAGQIGGGTPAGNAAGPGGNPANTAPQASRLGPDSQLRPAPGKLGL